MPTLSERLHSAFAPAAPRPLAAGECRTPAGKRCGLCFAGRITYETETAQKPAPLDAFWSALGTGIPLEPLVPSPLGRLYRTVSKRKAFIRGRTFTLGLIGTDDESERSFPMDVGQCAIEPAVHASVYSVVQTYLQKRENSSLAEEFNYVIVKGGDEAATVIFNMNHFSSANRREVNRISKHLTGRVPAVKGLFVFVDEERSRYYLSGRPTRSERPSTPRAQKLFGTDLLSHSVSGTPFRYSPLSFSQTNHAILPEFTGRAASLLQLSKDDALYDLYCGYGLFSLTLAPQVRSVTGVELSRGSISDAIANARRLRAENVKFLSADISPAMMRRLLGGAEKGTRKVLLDPPRSGTASGVIDVIAEARPAAVLHIFCNPPVIASELQRWKNAGYAPVTAVPFDMFPGTDEVELMVLLRRSA